MKKRQLSWKYAISEIIIVSIGILIAFGINTMSANFKKKNEVKEYQKSLNTDLEENLKSIDRIIVAQKQKVLELNSLIAQIESNKYDLDSLGAILFRQRKSPTFFPISGTFKSLVSQGKIEIFNTEIKRELFNLYDTNYERTAYNGVLYDKIYVDVYDKEVQNVINLRTKEFEDPSRLKSPEFIKHIILIIDEADSYLSLLAKSKKESLKMLKLINK